MVDFYFNAIFELPDIDLHNRILISSQNSVLGKSASRTARPKLWRPGARWRKQLQTSAWAQNVQENHPQPKMSESGDLKVFFEYGPTLALSMSILGTTSLKLRFRPRPREILTIATITINILNFDYILKL